MNRLNFFIGLLLGAIGGWLGDMYFGRTKLEGQISSLRTERATVQGQLKSAERVVTAQSAEIAQLTADLAAATSSPAVSTPAPVKSVSTPVAVETTTVANSGTPDNLRLIEGIGPKASAVLADAGVSTFAQMAAMDGEALMSILKAAKLRGKFYTESWSEQATVAATGDLEALKILQNELVGGRRVS